MNEVYHAPENCVVLSAHERQFRVSSDNAMIDSGSGFTVDLWDRVVLRTRSEDVHTGRGNGVAMPAPDATAEDRRLAHAYDTATAFVADVHGAAEEAHYIRQGRTVEVWKGRKAPKGRYEVTAHLNGQFGPCVHIRDAAGTRWNYVAVSNVKIVPDYGSAFAAYKSFERMHPDCPGFLAKVAGEGFTAHAWGVFADWVEQYEIDRNPNAGFSAAEFADALRRVTAAIYAATLSTYLADCHNEFRRPFGRA